MPPDLTPGQAKTWLRQEEFLHAYAELHTFLKASKAIGITFQAAYYWLKQNVLGFSDRLEITKAIIGDTVEAEAFRRILHPSKEPAIGTDLLEITMLNAWKPDRYKPALIINDSALKETLDRLRSLSKKLRDHETKAKQEQGIAEAPDAIEQAQDILAQRMPPRGRADTDQG